jgi:hypothetical protein
MEMTLIGPDLVPRGRLDWVNCTVVQKLNAKGTFTAQIVGESRTASRIVPGCRLYIRDPDAGAYSVLITTIERSMTSKGVLNLNLSGVDELAALAQRITYPSPDRAADQQTVEDYYTDSGTSGQIVCSMVLRNLGAASLDTRRWFGLVVDEADVGGQGEVKTRFKSLLDEAATVANLGKVRMVCHYQQDRKIHFTVEAITDRTRSMVFRQETGTLGEWTVSLTAPETTTFVLGGKGDLRERLVAEYAIADEDTWGWRSETFKDQTDAEDRAALDKAGAKETELMAGSASVNMTVNERPTANGTAKVYGRDYRIGDIVTARLGGATYTDQIQQAEIAWDEKGRSTKLTVGRTQDQDNDSPAWVRRVRDLDKRQRGRETN